MSIQTESTTIRLSAKASQLILVSGNETIRIPVRVFLPRGVKESIKYIARRKLAVIFSYAIATWFVHLETYKIVSQLHMLKENSRDDICSWAYALSSSLSPSQLHVYEDFSAEIAPKLHSGVTRDEIVKLLHLCSSRIDFAAVAEKGRLRYDQHA